MDVRLESAGRMLGSFLSYDLSEQIWVFHPMISSGPSCILIMLPSLVTTHQRVGLPKKIYEQMCSEFQNLYDLLINSRFNTSDDIPTSQQGGICALQSVRAFDDRHKYSLLPHPLPLVSEVDYSSSVKPSLSSRFRFNAKADKMKRLVALSSLSEAINRKDQSFYDCTLVQAYRGFEEDCLFPLSLSSIKSGQERQTVSNRPSQGLLDPDLLDPPDPLISHERSRTGP